jgi:hypothetical protein
MSPARASAMSAATGSDVLCSTNCRPAGRTALEVIVDEASFT